jgi:hypothetical protein
MAFTDHEIAKYTGLIEQLLWTYRRPPLHLRSQVREGQRFARHTIEFFYVRPAFERRGQFIEEPIAKVQLVRTRRVWRLYWMRGNCKWYAYPFRPETKSLAAALRLINEDASSCFFG